MPSLTTTELLLLLFRCGVEALVLAGIFCFAYSYGGIKNALQHLPRTSRRLLVGFLCFWFVVQLVDRWQYSFPTEISFYPLTRFAMYQVGHEQETPTAYRLEGVFEEGSRREVNLSLLFSAIGLPSLSTRFRVIQEGFESGDPRRVSWAAGQLNLFCESAVRLLDARGYEVPESVEFLSVTAEDDGKAIPGTIHEQVLYVWRP